MLFLHNLDYLKKEKMFCALARIYKIIKCAWNYLQYEFWVNQFTFCVYYATTTKGKLQLLTLVSSTDGVLNFILSYYDISCTVCTFEAFYHRTLLRCSWNGQKPLRNCNCMEFVVQHVSTMCCISSRMDRNKNSNIRFNKDLIVEYQATRLIFGERVARSK